MPEKQRKKTDGKRRRRVCRKQMSVFTDEESDVGKLIQQFSSHWHIYKKNVLSPSLLLIMLQFVIHCYANVIFRDVNRGSKNRNSLQIWVLEIEFSNSKLVITFCISVQAVTQAAGDRASRFCANGQTRHNGPACPLNRDAAAKADGQFAICDERGGALFTKGSKRWSVILYVRPAFVNSYPGVCGRRREGQTRVRAVGRPRLSPVPAVSLPPRPPPPRGGNPRGPLSGAGGRTDGQAMYAAALADRRGGGALDCTRRRRCYAVICNKYIAVTYVKFQERSRNIVVKISQRISRRKTLRLMP